MDNYIEKIDSIIIEFLEKLKEPTKLKEICISQENSMNIEKKQINLWYDCSIANGYPSVCILLAELDKYYQNKELNVLAHEYLLKAKEAFENSSANYDLCLFDGIVSLGFAAYTMSKDGIYYNKFLNKINELIINATMQKLKYINSSIYTKYDFYDSIKGLSGVARYLIYFKNDIKVRECLLKVIEYFIHLINDEILEKGKVVPKWYVNYENQFTDRERDEYRNGCFNIGMSHGITGVLSVLSISLLEEIELPCQRESISKLLKLLDKIKLKDEIGYFWPGRVKFENFVNNNYSEEKRDRASWCYGDPGIARAIYIAGKAVNDKYFLNLGLKTLKSIATCEENALGLDSPTFCHGYAGLLQIMNIMFNETKDRVFRQAADRLVEKILLEYNSTYKLSFKNVAVDVVDNIIYPKKVDNLGLLEGSVGTILALFNYKNMISLKWDTIFLLK